MECNFSVTLAENIGISWKISQYRGLTQNVSEYLEYIEHGFNLEYLEISHIYRRDLQHYF
jgi:hypothetical protein